MTTRVEESVVVHVPVRTAYDQWTQFEDFPLFMKDVDLVEQIDPTRLHWKTSMRGVTREWNAVITEQIPDARVAWESEDGARNAGVVTFHELEDETTKVMLQLDFEPEGVLEHYADAVGVVEQRAKKDLEAFKGFIEQRGRATGSWRGSVNHPEHEDESASPRYGDRPNDVRDHRHGDGSRHEVSDTWTASDDEPRRDSDARHDDASRREDVAVDHRAG